jgi:hypothetical protein
MDRQMCRHTTTTNTHSDNREKQTCSETAEQEERHTDEQTDKHTHTHAYSHTTEVRDTDK